MGVGLNIEREERITITYIYWVKFDDGFIWDADDLIETLEEVMSGEVYITDQKLAKWLVDRKVLASAGSSRWCSPASEGPEFETFFAELRQSRVAMEKKLETAA
jgi:hypothetical protein